MLYTLSQIDFGIILNICGSLFVNLGNNLQSIGGQMEAQKLKSQEEDVARINQEEDLDTLVAGDTYHPSEGTSTRDITLPTISPLMQGGKTGLKLDHITDDIKSHAPHPEKILKFTDHKPNMKELNEVCDTWFIGSCIFLMGALTVFISYRFAPQSLLAPLGSIQFVTNVIFARELHHAKITYSVMIATVVIISGIVMVVHYSPSPSTRFVRLDLHELQLLYTFPSYQAYLFSLLGLVLFCDGVFRVYRKFHLEGKTLYKDHIIRPLAYALPSCAIGSQSTLQAKCLSEVVFNKDWETAFEHWFTYIIVIMFLLSSFFWLSRMNYALNEFDPVFMIPVLQVFWIFFTTLNGGIYFREFMEPSFVHHKVLGFVFGMCVIGLGVALLSPNKSSQYLEDMATQANEKLQKDVILKHKDKFAFLKHLETNKDLNDSSSRNIELTNNGVKTNTPTRSQESSGKLQLTGSFSPEPIDFV